MKKNKTVSKVADLPLSSGNVLQSGRCYVSKSIRFFCSVDLWQKDLLPGTRSNMTKVYLHVEFALDEGFYSNQSK